MPACKLPIGAAHSLSQYLNIGADSCSMAEVFGTVDWSDLRGTQLGTSGIAAYGRGKLFFLMYSMELQRRLREAGLAGADMRVFATHPGLVCTGLMIKLDLR